MTCINTPHLNEHELAARWGVSIKTLRNWRRRGIGIDYLKLGRLVRYQVETVESYEVQHLKQMLTVIEKPDGRGFMNAHANKNRA